jgi:hypothetical protein
MKIAKFFPLIMLLVIGLGGCKYQEGPFISFTPRLERVSGTWIVGKAIVDGVESSSLDGFEYITLTKSGQNVEYKGKFLGIAYTLTGDWNFNEDESIIEMNLVDGTGLITFDLAWTILRLKEKEMWVTYTETDSNNVTTFTELHLITSVQ